MYAEGPMQKKLKVGWLISPGLNSSLDSIQLCLLTKCSNWFKQPSGPNQENAKEGREMGALSTRTYTVCPKL